MSDAAIFITVVGALFVLRLVATTAIFFWLLAAGDRCPHCDAPTLWIHSPVWSRVAPWLRPSWCPGCGWEGMLRHGTVTPIGAAPALRRQGGSMDGPDSRGPKGVPKPRKHGTAD